jgi:hypothetical protein
VYGKTFTLYVKAVFGGSRVKEGKEGETLPINEMRMHGVNWRL